ncbi:MAG: PTS sugar transporter subunit IIA [Gammaproteobacteria bacterium]|nr:PTS sugar transporter subunit IIA [Gammaproteobacteria bacterium]
MIELSDLLSPQSLHCRCEIKSKKKALQTVAELLGTQLQDDELSEMDFLDALIAREKLGSTGLGHGVSIPHGRIKGLEQPFASLITLAEGIDYDAPDNEKVDIVMGLVVPEHCNDEHLQILASLASVFSADEFRDDLRKCTSPEDMLKVVQKNDATVAGEGSACQQAKTNASGTGGK